MAASDGIAAVTEALRRRLQSALASSTGAGASDAPPLVTVLPLDRALADNPNGLNVFLYEVVPDGARGPWPARPGTPELVPLTLRLRYLVSALGPHDDGTQARDHRMLGLALRELHERPILDAAELSGEVARVVPLVLSAEELALLWSSSGASRRVSLAYEVSLVRIDARQSIADSQVENEIGRTVTERIVPTARWNDLVLPPSEVAALHEIVAQVVHASEVYARWGFARVMRGRSGVTALFVGQPGTGRRLAAEILASALGSELYAVDLGGIVSKYLEETERNLRRVFDDAEKDGAVLFLDEADALFGRRDEVADACDRYAIVKRMASYRGLAILASTRTTALDRATLELLRFVIEFPPPGREARRAIWAAAFPAKTPIASSIELDRLAELPLSGGSIRNVALNAAFMAAAANEPVTMAHVLASVELERRKLAHANTTAER